MRRCTFLITVGLVLFLTGAWANRCAAETLVYPMQYRTAAEAVPMVQSLLSPGGRAVADARTNALLVVDDEETIQRVREFLQGLTNLETGEDSVRFDESGARERTGVEGRARASGEDWSVSAGKPMRKDGVEILHMADPYPLKHGNKNFPDHYFHIFYME